MFTANIEIPSVEFPDNPSILEVSNALRESGFNFDLRIKKESD